MWSRTHSSPEPYAEFIESCRRIKKRADYNSLKRSETYKPYE